MKDSWKVWEKLNLNEINVINALGTYVRTKRTVEILKFNYLHMLQKCAIAGI